MWAHHPERAFGALSWAWPSTNKPEPQILNSQSDTQEAPNAKWPHEVELLLTQKCLKLPHTQRALRGANLRPNLHLSVTTNCKLAVIPTHDF